MGMRDKLAFETLGATLFVPASHKNLQAILSRKSLPNLKSIVIDTEDGLSDSALESALEKIQILLSHLKSTNLHIFLRPRNAQVLQAFLSMRGIEKIEGFVLPKFSLPNAAEYLTLLAQTRHSFMPSIEGDELFDTSKLIELKALLLEHKERIVLVRIGLEDMLSHLGLRRSREESAFDFSATNVVLGNFIAAFKSAGFGVSGGVYPYYEDYEGFIKDVKRDLKEGLFTKTIIHPNQIEPLHELYKASKEELAQAEATLHAEEAVFGFNGAMIEKSTMYNYALFIKLRSKIYGTFT